MESSYVSIYDISIGLMYLIILFSVANSRKNKILDFEIKKYYLRNVLFKFFFAITFAVVYLIFYGGGDTTAYWDGAVTLNNLFFKSPTLYLENLINEPSFKYFRLILVWKLVIRPDGLTENQKLGSFVKLHR